MVALVDDADYPRVSQLTWQARLDKKSGIWYAAHHFKDKDGKHRRIHLHRFILRLPGGYRPQVAHMDRDGLNNQRYNIEACTASENAANRIARKGHLLKGVQPRDGKWRARICRNGKQVHLGTYASSKDAAGAYDDAAFRLFGKFARPNAVLTT